MLVCCWYGTAPVDSAVPPRRTADSGSCDEVTDCWGREPSKAKMLVGLVSSRSKVTITYSKILLNSWLRRCVVSSSYWPIWWRECGPESRSGSKRKPLTVRERISNIRQRLGIQWIPTCSLSVATFSLSLVSVVPLFSRDCEVTSWLGFSPFLPQICLHAFEKKCSGLLY